MVWTHPSDTCGAPTIFIISPLADKVIRAADSLIAPNLYFLFCAGCHLRSEDFSGANSRKSPF